MSDRIHADTPMENLPVNEIGQEMKHRYEEALSQLCLIGRINSLVEHLDDMPGLCLSIIGIITEFTPAENCSIMLSDPETGALKLFVAKGRGDNGSFLGFGNLGGTVFSAGEGAAGWAAESGEVLSIDDCEADNRFIEMRSSSKKVSSLITAPIVSEDAVIGVINCSHSRKEQFRAIDKQNIALLADHAAVLLQRASASEQAAKERRELKEKIEEQSLTCADTEDKFAALQEQLYKSEKFVTLGELLAGVAHELNNRVAPILIYAQMLQQSTTDELTQKRLRVIEESAMGAKTILESLLSHSREGAKDKEPVDLNQTLRSTLTLVDYKIRNQGIKLSVDISPHLPSVMVNDKQMAQVLLNIINNAVHAMENSGGELAIKSRHDRSHITITIADSGPGVPEKLSERIFSPFFTTKEVGKGTGLGLSISKRYVEENGGSLYVESTPSGGAAFVIEIPVMERDDQLFVDYIAPGEESVELAQILVVDDDSTIQNVIRDVLGPSYNVEFAGDGRDAMLMIQDNPFDLLLVDYHMPSFDGKQLYEWIADNHPSLTDRILFSTGDIYHEGIRDFIESTGCGCLVKPFSTVNLREAVARALDA